MTDYQVGDTVIHSYYGLGEIVMMDEKFIHERQMLCYVVRIRNMLIWVKADEEGKSGLRPPTPESDFERILPILTNTAESLPENIHERRERLIERMKDGKLSSICAVIRDLNSLQQKRKLNDYDKNTAERAIDFLVDEWKFSRSVTKEQAHAELMALLHPAG